MPGAASPLLRVDGLTVRYGALTALSDMSWQVECGRDPSDAIGPNATVRARGPCFAAVTHAVHPRRARSGWPTKTSSNLRTSCAAGGAWPAPDIPAQRLLRRALAARERHGRDAARALRPLCRSSPALAVAVEAGTRRQPSRSRRRRPADLPGDAPRRSPQAPGRHRLQGRSACCRSSLAYGAGARASADRRASPPGAGGGRHYKGGWPTLLVKLRAPWRCRRRDRTSHGPDQLTISDRIVVGIEQAAQAWPRARRRRSSATPPCRKPYLGTCGMTNALEAAGLP